MSISAYDMYKMPIMLSLAKDFQYRSDLTCMQTRARDTHTYVVYSADTMYTLTSGTPSVHHCRMCILSLGTVGPQ
jgi:hypothetical protein